MWFGSRNERRLRMSHLQDGLQPPPESTSPKILNNLRTQFECQFTKLTGPRNPAESLNNKENRKRLSALFPGRVP